VHAGSTYGLWARLGPFCLSMDLRSTRARKRWRPPPTLLQNDSPVTEPAARLSASRHCARTRRDKPPTGSSVVHAAGASSRPVLALFSVHRWESDGWWFVGWRPARRTASFAARGGVDRSCAGGWGGSEPTAIPPPRAGATRVCWILGCLCLLVAPG
jgi:hypothetical protein